MPTEQALEQWGLSPKETKVYLAGLELGAVPVQDLAKKTGIERTNVYSIVEGLIHQGLFTETEKSGKKYFVAESPEKLVLKLKEREKEIESVLPELKSIYNLSPQKPKVRFYEGVEGVKLVYEDTLDENKPIVAFSDYEYLIQAMSFDYMLDYASKRAAKGITFRSITRPSKGYQKYAPYDKKQLREVKLLPGVDFSTEINVYGNKVALMSFRKEVFAVIIESQEIANTLNVVFNSLWNLLGSINHKQEK